jgi:hypothetical protein
MNKPVLVTAFYPDLISKFKNQTFVIHSKRAEEIRDIYNTITDHNGLFCIDLALNDVLSTLSFDESLEGIPIYLSCKGMGNFRDFLKIKSVLSRLNIKIFFPADAPGNFTEVKILSSLGIKSGIILSPLNNWDLVNDLMVYSVYSKAHHAPIEPFQYAMEHYDPLQLLNLGSLYFNNPAQFLHLDRDENIAISHEKLIRGEFIGKGAGTIKEIHKNPAYLAAVQSWQEYFMKTDGCAYCKSWRVCLGEYYDHSGKNPGCEAFFSDLMDTSENYKKIKQNGR